jgi:hypothetical protein
MSNNKDKNNEKIETMRDGKTYLKDLRLDSYTLNKLIDEAESKKTTLHTLILKIIQEHLRDKARIKFTRDGDKVKIEIAIDFTLFELLMEESELNKIDVDKLISKIIRDHFQFI